MEALHLLSLLLSWSLVTILLTTTSCDAFTVTTTTTSTSTSTKRQRQRQHGHAFTTIIDDRKPSLMIASTSLLLASSTSATVKQEEEDYYDDGFDGVDVEEEEEELDFDEDDDDEDENELTLQFIDSCLDTPVGQLEIDDVELLRKILDNDFDATASSTNIEEEEIFKESLLYRSIDEWKYNKNQQQQAATEEELQVLSTKESLLRPKSIHFYHVIKAWKTSKNPDKVVRVLNLLSDQRDIAFKMKKDTTYDNPRHEFDETKPSLDTVECVLQILLDCNERGIDKRAMMVVDSLADYNLDANDTITAILIRIIAKGRFRGAADRAESLLRDAVQEFPPDQFDGINTEVFNSVVLAWAKSREDGGPQRAQELIVFMDGLDAPQCKPNRFTFTSLIDAYAQTNEWDGVREAERIFNNVLDQYVDDGQADLEPNVATWTIVISAWARLSKRNRRGAAKRAGNLLKRMEQLYTDGRINVKPDAIAYWTCLNAYAFSKEKDDIEDGEQLLDEMNELYLDGDDAMRPSLLSVKLLADAWIKIGEMDRAEKVFAKYEEYIAEERDSDGKDSKGLEELYESFLFGYCKNGDPKRAKVYLDMMADDKNIEPSNACYDRIIDAYIKEGNKNCAKNAHGIFEMMERRREIGALSPSERVYTSFIRALAKSKVPDLHKKVDLILKRMNKLYEESKIADMKPSIYTYNCALNACSACLQIESVSPSEAFQTSVRIFAELRKETDPDQVTFGNLMRCSNLLPESEMEKKVKFVKATFQLCRDAGLVNNLVLRDLKNAASDEIWAELTKLPLDVSVEEESVLDLLPSTWSRNVKRRQLANPDEPARRKFNASRY